jgi:hypothetical protein
LAIIVLAVLLSANEIANGICLATMFDILAFTIEAFDLNLKFITIVKPPLYKLTRCIKEKTPTFKRQG